MTENGHSENNENVYYFKCEDQDFVILNLRQDLGSPVVQEVEKNQDGTIRYVRLVPTNDEWGN